MLVAILVVLCVGLTTFAGIATAQEGTFVPTGSMAHSRSAHAATLLGNGKVLIAGGLSTQPGAATGAELYDPATGTFSVTGSLNTAREVGHTATLLNNGKVLIAGAVGLGLGASAMTSAELYDPTTGTFTPTGNMNTGRQLHTATLLNNGMVLVAGGASVNNIAPTTSAELYDPATGVFTATGSMNEARTGHTATKLSDGKVLITGGAGGNSPGSAEVYDPATGTFTPTGNMSTGRSNHTATLLNDGKVLVVGGASTADSAELYDPVTGTFALAGSMNTPRYLSSATLLSNGLVLIAGGGATNPPTASAELYDPSTGTFGVTGSLNIGRYSHSAILLNDKTVLIAGGHDNSVELTSAELYELVALFPTTLSFSNQVVNMTSAPQTVTLTNNRAAALGITSIGFGGANASDFAETDNCPASVAAGASCAIHVTFAPPVTGSRMGSLSLVTNISANPLGVPLTGTGVVSGPIASLSSTSVVFAAQSLGTTSTAQAVTVRNAGTTALNVQAVALAGANVGDFAIASGTTCTSGAPVVPNSSCVIQLTFAPTALGVRNAMVSLTDNAADSPETISLIGGGTVAKSVSISPTSISFAAQYVGTSGLPQSVTVTNNGNSSLNISGVTVSPSDFGMLNACGSGVAVGASCAIGVFFDPTASGTRTGTLTINDDAPGSPHTVALSGTEEDFSLSSGTSGSATVSAGQTAHFTLAISAAGGFSQSVTFSCSGAPAQSTCAVSPSSIAPGGSAPTSVTVTVTTTAASLLPTNGPFGGYRLYLIVGVLAMLLLSCLLRGHSGRRLRLAYGYALFLLAWGGVLLSYGCGGGGTAGGGGNPRTPAGTYTLVVTGTFASGSTTLTHNTNLTLVVQ